MTPEDARERLRRVALAVTEASESEAVARFLERLAALEGCEELRAALVLEGARALLQEVRPCASDIGKQRNGPRDLDGPRFRFEPLDEEEPCSK